MTRVAGNPAFQGLVAGLGDSFTNMLLNSPKQFESVLQVANRNTEFIDSPAMQRSLEASDFELSGLKTNRAGMSLYLCLPQRFMNTHYRWLRMMIALTVTEMEIVRGRPATGFPVLMLLDEFAGLKRMEVIEQAVAQIAGYGVKLFFVLQTLEQLKAVYKDNWETFLSNSGLRIFFSLDDYFSREYVSKLVGETEVIREVRSGSTSDSESESVSRSVGSSESRSRSLSEGTNRSATDSESTGTNSSTTRSKGRSWGESWTPKTFLFAFTLRKNRQDSRGRNFSRSTTEGTSQGQSHSETGGVSHGSSESYGSTSSETDGVSHGVSRSRTTGASETIQKRALVTPDEIGQLFARINDVDQGGYPGLALIVISGERAIALRRVNYFEDIEFARRFEPHPDYPSLPRWKELTVACTGFVPYDRYFATAGIPESRITAWPVSAGQMVSAGDPVVSLEYQETPVSVRAPFTGMITKLPEDKQRVTWLFGLRYRETDEPEVDPFYDFAAFEGKFTANIKAAMFKARLSILAASILAVLFAIGAFGAQQMGLLAAVGLAVFWGARKAVEAGNCGRILSGRPKELLEDGRSAVAWRILADSTHTAEQLPAPLESDPPAPAEVPATISPVAPGNETTASVPTESEIECLADANARSDGEASQSQSDAGAEPIASEPVASFQMNIQAAPAQDLPEAPIFGRSDVEAEVTEEPPTPVNGGGEIDPAPGTGRFSFPFKFTPRVVLGMCAVVMAVIVAAAWPSKAAFTLTRVLRGHDGYVHTLAFAPNNRMLASGSADQTIKLWDVNTGHELRTLAGHNGAVNSVAFSPDGRLLASGSSDGTIKFWDVMSGKELVTLAGHHGAVNSIAFNPDGRLLASTYADQIVELWDVAIRQEVLVLTLEGKQGSIPPVAFGTGDLLAAGIWVADGTIKLWRRNESDRTAWHEVRTLRELRTLEEKENGYYIHENSLAISPDGHLLASGNVRLGDVPCALTVWDVNTGMELHTFSVKHGEVTSVVFSPDGQQVASGNSDHTIRMWDVSTGKELNILTNNESAEWSSVAFSPNGEWLGGGTQRAAPGTAYAVYLWKRSKWW